MLHRQFDCVLLDISRRFSADTAVHVVPEDDHVKDQEGPNKAVGGRPKDKTAFREPIGNYLQNYGRDLTQDAENGLIDPLIGREDVLERTLAILLRRTKNNPILLGDPGVGKTAIAEGIAQLLVSDHCPRSLKGCSLVAVDVGGLVSGTQYRGTFEERLTGLLKDIRRAQGRIILFIDEIHMIMDTGRTEGGLNAANLLKPALARGELHMIGATTLEEYREHVEKDAAFSRRLQPVMVEEPTPVECLAWLQGLRGRYEEHHHVKFSDEAISAAITAAGRFISTRKLPDSAIDLLDESASRVQLKYSAQYGDSTAQVKKLGSRIQQNVTAGRKEVKNALSCPHCGTITPVLNEQILKVTCPKCLYSFLPIPQEKLMLGSSLFLGREDIPTTSPSTPKNSNLVGQEFNGMPKAFTVPVVEEEDVLHVAASASGLHVSKLMTILSERKALDVLHENLMKGVQGQQKAIEQVVKSIRLGFLLAKSGNRKRPLSIVLLRGPPGTGKKTTSRIIADSLFGVEKALISYDMSQYSDRTASSKLVGAAPGFVGYGDGGSLTDAVRRNPHSVILFENIDKCHPDIVALIRQIAHKGYIEDGMGRHIDFRNTILVLTASTPTTNSVDSKRDNMQQKDEVRDHQTQSKNALEMSPPGPRQESAPNHATIQQMHDCFDAIIPFDKLSMESLKQVAKMELESYSGEEMLALCGVHAIHVDQAVYDDILFGDDSNVQDGHDAALVVKNRILEPILDRYTSMDDKETHRTQIKVSTNGTSLTFVPSPV